ncbi:MAG: hypothetical protein ACE5G5_08740 [Candidatus Methylomirabilales bacterium]
MQNSVELQNVEIRLDQAGHLGRESRVNRMGWVETVQGTLQSFCFGL